MASLQYMECQALWPQRWRGMGEGLVPCLDPRPHKKIGVRLKKGLRAWPDSGGPSPSVRREDCIWQNQTSCQKGLWRVNNDLKHTCEM